VSGEDGAEKNERFQMTKREKFQLYVYLGALKRDMDNDTNESQVIMAYAERVPEENIPACPQNAAKVFLSFVGGRSEPWRWMMTRRTVGLPRVQLGKDARIETKEYNRMGKSFARSVMWVAMFCLAAGTEQEMDGWRGAKWGMTEDEVMKAFPDEARRMPKAEAIAAGGFATIRLERVMFLESPFSARFIMDQATNGRLNAVSFRMDKSEKFLGPVFNRLEQSLTEKYGKPIYRHDDANKEGLDELRQWKKGTTRIELLHGEIYFNRFKLLVITYSQIKADRNL
jgi:hypothetical protein